MTRNRSREGIDAIEVVQIDVVAFDHGAELARARVQHLTVRTASTVAVRRALGRSQSCAQGRQSASAQDAAPIQFFQKFLLTRNQLPGRYFLGVYSNKQFRELLLEGINLRTVANLNIRVVGIEVGVVLMVILGAIERLRGVTLGHYRPWKNLLLIKLRNVGIRQPLLVLVRIENR